MTGINKISLIIIREYLTRVRKKSFIIMTLLSPLLFASVIVVPAWISQVEDKGLQHIAVLEAGPLGEPVPDSLQLFRDVLGERENLHFDYLSNMRLDDLLATFKVSAYDGVLYLPQNLVTAGKEVSVEFYYRETPSLSLESQISSAIEKHIFNSKLISRQIPSDVIESLETNVTLKRINWESWPEMKEDSTDVKRALGYIGGILIYLFILLYGSQVMRGVLEEKTSRIVEVIVSSVTPFQLMMGKIIGIGLIGLTQFLIWLVLTFSISGVAQQIILPGASARQVERSIAGDPAASEGTLQAEQSLPGNGTVEIADGIFRQLRQVNFILVIGSFLFFFLGGYILYGSLFAAIGAASDNETDTQQFMWPVTIPLILGFVIMINAFSNPSGKLAILFSIIPLTSPIVMMARIPFEVPFLQVLASAALLILTFLGTTWLAGKIYRTGILMYGKKVTYRELWKWIKY